jgi:tRNA synthetases class I (R)
MAGAALEAGGSAEATLTDLAPNRRYSVQFWDANATKALHIGHLRNLAIGNALASALAQGGAQVERRSLISDAGRSMGEAMAGVMNSGRHADSWPDGDEKSDHFVGVCYADYVASAVSFEGAQIEHPEDSLTRELTPRNDAADELLLRVLAGEREALELWSKTRAWVIAGQRRTLARLGIAFDRVFFESDFLAQAAELTASGLRDGRLYRREDGVISYATGLADFEEFPLVRADGVPTQHMRALAYWMTAPELDDVTSMQVCGTEWVSHVTCRRKLMNELLPARNGNGHGGADAIETGNANGDRKVDRAGHQIHPTTDIFNGMVARQKRALASSEGALLIDDLSEWIESRLDADPKMRAVRRAHPYPERVTAQIALGYFLPHPVAPRIDFEPDKLLLANESLGWDLVRARARRGLARSGRKSAVRDLDYRFAVVQAELYRRYLRLAVQRLDVRPLAHYLKHLARWYLERDRSERVENVVETLLERSARGLGLQDAP